MTDNVLRALDSMPLVLTASLLVLVVMFFATLVVMTLSALHERDLNRAREEWEETHGMKLTRW